MSFEKVECFALECDNCKEIYQQSHSDYSIWIIESDAWDNAQDDDWVKNEEKHYCPDCYTYDDNDKLFIRHERTK